MTFKTKRLFAVSAGAMLTRRFGLPACINARIALSGLNAASTLARCVGKYWLKAA
jgi:hypothetical protein